MTMQINQIELERTLQLVQQRSDAGQPLSSDERRLAVTHAEAVMVRQSHDVAGADHKAVNTFGRLRLMAREIAGHLARAGGSEANNPFRDDSLRAVYDAERRWLAFVNKRGEPVTLQALVDQRASLTGEVHRTATAMHIAQLREADLYWSVDQHSSDEPYRTAAAFSQESVSIFRQAAAELRQFVSEPTQQSAPLAEFRELQRLEGVVASSRAAYAEISEGPMASGFGDDAKNDVDSAQGELARFMRDKNITVPAAPSAATASAASMSDDCDCSDTRVVSKTRAR
jgi:hypothetical protein